LATTKRGRARREKALEINMICGGLGAGSRCFSVMAVNTESSTTDLLYLDGESPSAVDITDKLKNFYSNLSRSNPQINEKSFRRSCKMAFGRTDTSSSMRSITFGCQHYHQISRLILHGH